MRDALATPVTSRQAWTRLALLVLTLAMALGTLVLSTATRTGTIRQRPGS